jgi:hypothetical protein
MEESTIDAQKQVATLSADELVADQGAGLENVTPEDLIVPQLKLVQTNSPIVDPNEGAYIAGAKVGDIVNSVTGEFYDGDKGIKVVPVAYRRVFLEFIDREMGGGLVQIHDNPSILSKTTRSEKGQDVLEGGNYIQTTANHYILIIEGDKATPVMVAMSSTQLKKSRRWNSIMAGIRMTSKDGRSFVPASYSHVYSLASSPEKNNKGSWYGWRIDLEGRLEDVNVYKQAKAFASSVASDVEESSEVKEIEAF